MLGMNATRADAATNVIFRELTLEVGAGRNRRTLIDCVDEHFRSGEVTCIIGESGVGKSTLLRAIAGLVATSSGQILVGGRDTGTFTAKDRLALRRYTVTVVEQDYNLLETLTAHENILLLLELAGLHDRSSVADSWMEQLGLQHVRDEFPVTLSGGEQQRVAIARSLAAPHPVVLADEPTGALDSGNTERVTRLLREFARAGKCCVVVTHDPKVADGADRVLTMRDGGLG